MPGTSSQVLAALRQERRPQRRLMRPLQPRPRHLRFLPIPDPFHDHPAWRPCEARQSRLYHSASAVVCWQAAPLRCRFHRSQRSRLLSARRLMSMRMKKGQRHLRTCWKYSSSGTMMWRATMPCLLRMLYPMGGVACVCPHSGSDR